MHTTFIFLSFFLLLFTSFNATANDAAGASTEWKMTQLSEERHFNTTLTCLAPPAVGGFQNCQLTILVSEDQVTNKLLKNAKVEMEGGMPAHHHGLPTSPVVSWSDVENAYVIKGLKYSMPGDWFLSFYIQDEVANTNINKPTVFNSSNSTGNESGKTVRDKVSFKFII